jgi:hypothetical protein
MVLKTLFRATALISLLLTTIQAENLQNFIYKDEVHFTKEFYDEVNTLGTELFNKTGISVYMVIYSKTGDKHLVELEKELLNGVLPENSVVLGFADAEKKVDIQAHESVLKLFDRDQILSPYPWTGTILPILGEKVKGDPRKKYAVALFNGYADIVEQIAESRDVELSSAVGNSNKYVLNILRLFFYGTIVVALFYLIYRKFIKKGGK